MCYTYRVLESMDSNIYLSMLYPELDKCTSKVEVELLSVFIMKSTPSVTVNTTEDSDNSDDGEFFDALTGEDLFPVDDDWGHEDWGHEDWITQDIDTKEDNLQTEEDDTSFEADTYSEDSGHPFAGWHSQRLVNSDWVNHSFIDKTDHIDTWARRSASSSLARCNWVAFPEDGGWPKPENDHVWGAPEAPELRLVTPEGDVWWLDDPVDYEALPWEREVAEERNRILSAIW
ncbi:hypothetical protein GE21DRAFT_2427 [Neurospora crassa]|uniref:Uncharacterized protein n=2 Tax=Neurospora crassa TaxID=5141 RepID=Q7SDC6_NEUCR|nr:hypothetical protein NCU02866 [Neurospora crassa OR74A]EAA34764.1 hypothetical protein NCU02866 [Neurospora crassa OR74A]KHE78691.1 hypothetical protein GE21DRAFT_2427 [Neurospora crassa]CAE76219.1 hypothetical protein [Neurospora crassa]|eukprot:XP_964000.1 hypothetical protein NCU02866 [Neurospora crassa OR74A]